MALSVTDMKHVLKAVFKHHAQHGTHVPLLFWGASGVGKTASIPQVAEELSVELGEEVRPIIFKPGQADGAGDLLGMPEKVSYSPCPWCLSAEKPSDEYTEAALGGHAWSKHAKDWASTQEALRAFGDRVQTRQRFAITDVWPTTGPVLVCVDEINRAPPDIRNALFGLINERVFELSGYRLPDRAIVFGTANPNTAEYGDTHDLDGAMIKRFVHFQVQPTPEEWLAYMATQPESQTPAGDKALAFFRAHPEFITPTEAANPVLENLQAANRTCTALVRMANILTGRLLSEAAAGTLGAKAASAFMQHMSAPEEWVRAAEVLSSYPRVRLAVLRMRDEGRNDMFQQTQEDVLRHLAQREKTLKDAEIAHFAAFLGDLLADQVWSLLSALNRLDAAAPAKAPIKRHFSALSANKAVIQLVAAHNKRVGLVQAAP